MCNRFRLITKDFFWNGDKMFFKHDAKKGDYTICTEKGLNTIKCHPLTERLSLALKYDLFELLGGLVTNVTL